MSLFCSFIVEPLLDAYGVSHVVVSADLPREANLGPQTAASFLTRMLDFNRFMNTFCATFDGMRFFRASGTHRSGTGVGTEYTPTPASAGTYTRRQ